MKDQSKKIEKYITIKAICITLAGISAGVWLASQINSINKNQDQLRRNGNINIFREIQLVKKYIDQLKIAEESLEKKSKELNNQQSLLEEIQKEIVLQKIIAGKSKVYGEGVIMIIDANVLPLWLTDITNDLFTAGAEAVSVNDIRITNSTAGFFQMPNGSLLLGGEIINKPITVKAIGDQRVLIDSLTQKDGVVDRLNEYNNNIKVEVKNSNKIEMD